MHSSQTWALCFCKQACESFHCFVLLKVIVKSMALFRQACLRKFFHYRGCEERVQVAALSQRWHATPDLLRAATTTQLCCLLLFPAHWLATEEPLSRGKLYLWLQGSSFYCHPFCMDVCSLLCIRLDSIYHLPVLVALATPTPLSCTFRRSYLLPFL